MTKLLTDREVLKVLQSGTPLARAWKKFSSHAAKIEQAGMQRTPPTPIEVRRMELTATEEILAAYNGPSAGFCQPMDKGVAPPQKWMITFDDRDMSIEIYHDEAEAIAAFEARNVQWNCYLWTLVPKIKPKGSA